MKLHDIVRSIVIENEITDDEIIKTIEFLTQDNILCSPKSFKKIVDRLNREMEYENAPV